MDTETPSVENIQHEFFVTLPGGARGKVTIVATPSGDIVSSMNTALLAASPVPVAPTPFTVSGPQVAGIRKIQNADGSITPMPSEKVKRDIRLFVETSPCWFPECEALRAAYNEDVANLPAGCPSCEKGALMRKYLKKMETMNTDPA